MDQQKLIDVYSRNKDIIPKNKEMAFRVHLANASNLRYESFIFAKTYNPNVVLMLSIFLGALGVDRFYIGDVSYGIMKLLFGWLTLGIWPILDIYFCYQKAKQKNYDNLIKAAF